MKKGKLRHLDKDTYRGIKIKYGKDGSYQIKHRNEYEKFLDRIRRKFR